MNCPKCGEEMQLGYIQCRDGVYWRPKRRMIAALPTTAYKCEKCRQIVIKY